MKKLNINPKPILYSSDVKKAYDREKAKYENSRVNHPPHYTKHPSGVECITITEHMSFNLGNAVKYIWRYRDKNGIEDLKKAVWYINREIDRLGKASK